VPPRRHPYKFSDAMPRRLGCLDALQDTARRAEGRTQAAAYLLPSGEGGNGGTQAGLAGLASWPRVLLGNTDACD